MQTVTVTRLIEADLHTVWGQISDVTLVANWHPAVQTVDLLSSSPVGLGATRRCNFYDGSDVVEEIIEVPDDHSIRIRISGFSGPISSFETLWTAHATASGATQVTVLMSYEMKYGILGTAMNLLVVQGRMPRLVGKVLAGLERHVATGEVIDRQFRAA
jgi:ribosome-associated toxin RatA of RatAB toxin-antitoxin module